MQFYIEVINKLGVFKGEIITGTEQDYLDLLNRAKNFYNESGYEMYLTNGEFFIIGPELLRQSVMVIYPIIE